MNIRSLEKSINKPIVDETGQTEINFVDVAKIVEELSEKYPYAKLNPKKVEYKGDGIYIVDGKEMDLEGLREHISDINFLNIPGTGRKDLE